MNTGLVKYTVLYCMRSDSNLRKQFKFKNTFKKLYIKLKNTFKK
jgi:hypothetical protein